MRQSFQVKTIKSSETNQVISYLSLLHIRNFLFFIVGNRVDEIMHWISPFAE